MFEHHITYILFRDSLQTAAVAVCGINAAAAFYRTAAAAARAAARAHRKTGDHLSTLNRHRSVVFRLWKLLLQIILDTPFRMHVYMYLHINVWPI